MERDSAIALNAMFGTVLVFVLLAGAVTEKYVSVADRCAALEDNVSRMQKQIAQLSKPEIIVEDWRGRPGLPSRHKLPSLGGMGVR